MFDLAPEHAQPVAPEIRERLLEPFISATRVAVGEMTGAELAVRTIFQTLGFRRAAGIAAEIELTLGIRGALILSFPIETARLLSRRMLPEIAELDDSLVGDCVAEIANVAAGQAKALLAGTSYAFAFSVPEIIPITAAPRSQREQVSCLTVVFTGEHGDFALQLLH